MSELGKLQKRIEHLVVNTGIHPTVLEVSPNRWDALKYELQGDRRYVRPLGMLDMEWDDVKQFELFGVRVIKGRHE